MSSKLKFRGSVVVAVPAFGLNDREKQMRITFGLGPVRLTGFIFSILATARDSIPIIFSEPQGN